MKIILMAENEEEKRRYGEDGVEHNGVREFLIFGNKNDEDGDIVDFHEWNGSYRYLLGSIGYFEKIIDDKRREQEVGVNVNLMASQEPKGMIKKGSVPNQNIQLMDVQEGEIINQDIDIDNFEEQVKKASELAGEKLSQEHTGLRII
jgi:hypothetical protein